MTSKEKGNFHSNLMESSPDDKLEEEKRNSEEVSDEEAHRVLNEAFDETDNECKSKQLKEYEANKKQLVSTKEPANRRGLAFLRRKWTLVEFLTTCALYFEVFGWVSGSGQCWSLFAECM